MGFLELLTIIFILLKVFSFIDWSWWLVFSPLYVYVVIYGVYFILYGIGIVLTFIGVSSKKAQMKRARNKYKK